MIAFGIGARSDATTSEILDAMTQAEHACHATAQTLATFNDAKVLESARAAAAKTAADFVALPLTALQARSNDCHSHSQRSANMFGVASIAEAAALAATGTGSTLIMPRMVCGLVTVAAAVSRTHAEGLP